MSLIDARTRFARAVCFTALATSLPASPAGAADALITVPTATFNQFLNTIQPIQITGRYALRTTVHAGIFGKHTITWCDSAYIGTVSGLTIDINSSRIRAQGDVAFSWCGLNFGAPGRELTAIGDVTYHSASSALRLQFGSAIVRPTFRFLDWTVVLPVSIDIASMLNLPPIPIRPSLVAFETANSQRYMRISPINVSVAKAAGRVMVSSDVGLY